MSPIEFPFFVIYTSIAYHNFFCEKILRKLPSIAFGEPCSLSKSGERKRRRVIWKIYWNMFFCLFSKFFYKELAMYSLMEMLLGYQEKPDLDYSVNIPKKPCIVF